MKSLVVFTFVFALHTLVMAQKENNANVVAHMTGDEEISLNTNFEFLKSISINLVTGNEGSPSNLNYMLRYPESESYMAMSISGFSDDAAESIPEVVLDFDQRTRITFMSFGDIKMARTHTLDEGQENVSIIDFNPGVLKETGNSEDILGLESIEYILTDGDYRGSIWLTANVDERLKKQFVDLGLKFRGADSNSPSGYIMRVTADNTVTKEIMHLNINEIKTDDVYSIDARTYVTTASPSR